MGGAIGLEVGRFITIKVLYSRVRMSAGAKIPHYNTKKTKRGLNVQEFSKRIKERHNGGHFGLGEVCTGIASEGGEVVEEFRKFCYENKPLYQGNIVNEMADVLHYIVLGCEYFGIELEDLAQVNDMKMDAIDAGERDTFDLLLSDWDYQLETLEDRLGSVKSTINKLERHDKVN